MTPRFWYTICALVLGGCQLAAFPTATYNLVGVAAIWAILAIAWRPDK